MCKLNIRLIAKPPFTKPFVNSRHYGLLSLSHPDSSVPANPLAAPARMLFGLRTNGVSNNGAVAIEVKSRKCKCALGTRRWDVYIYIYIERERKKERDIDRLCVYVYVYVYVCVYVYVYVYIYIYICVLASDSRSNRLFANQA